MKRRQEPSIQFTMNHFNAVMAVIVVLLFVFVPNIPAAVAVATQARFAPSDAWHNALYWVKDNTPEPFDDPDFYNEFYNPATYQPPESTYGVMSWWDYGYWITRIGHRVPVVNPSQPPQAITNVARFLLSQEEALGQEIIQDLNSPYIIIDNMTTTSKFWAIIDWAGGESSEFFETYLLPQENGLTPVNLFYPEYYRSMGVRLYNFDGKAVTSVSPIVVSYEIKADRDGKFYKLITGGQDFSNYQEALDFVKRQESGNHRIVGGNQFVSPVPLEALRDYKLVFSSDTGTMQPEVGFVSEVKAFEYNGG